MITATLKLFNHLLNKRPGDVQVGFVSYSAQDVINQAIPAPHFYEIFRYVFIKPEGVFADPRNPHTIAMVNALIGSMERNNLIVLDVPKLLAHVFIKPEGIFTDPENPHTIAIAKALINLVKHNNLSYVANYELFKDAFIKQTGIFADPGNPHNKEMAEAIIGLVKDRWLSQGDNYKIFEHVFIRREGIFTELKNPQTKTIIGALIDLLKMEGSFSNADRRTIYNLYLSLQENADGFNELEAMMLDLLAAGKLQEPEVINKITMRLANSAIHIPSTNQGLDFFIKLSMATNMPLLGLLSDNL